MADDIPLSEEQIAELNALAQSPPEQQREKITAYLQTLTPEQRAFLQKQQSGGCPFCLIAEKKLQSFPVYEDDLFIAVLDIRPAAKGHVLVMPKRHYQLLAQLDDASLGKLFALVAALSKVVFQGMKAEGTNIFAASGAAAGQTVPHAAVHIIPRWKDDGITFHWQGTALQENELKEIQKAYATLLPGMLPPPEPRDQLRTLPKAVEWDEEERIP